METDYLGGNYSGTGGLFASCLLGYRMLGAELSKALHVTMDFILHSVQEAAKEQVPGNDGISFEKYLPKLWNGIDCGSPGFGNEKDAI